MKLKQFSLAALVSALTLTLSQTVIAHEGFPQLIPMQFHPHDDVATIYYTRGDKLNEPEYVGPNVLAGEFRITNPRGKDYGLSDENKLHYLQQLVVLEAQVKEQGTYKINLTRNSRIFPWGWYQGKGLDIHPRQTPKPFELTAELQAEIDKLPVEQQQETYKNIKQVQENFPKQLEKYNKDIKLKPAERGFLFDDEFSQLNEKDKYGTTHVHNFTAYLSKGTPTNTVLKPTNEGLEFDYKVHPNQITTKSGLQFNTLLNGKVLPDFKIGILQQGDAKASLNFTSDKNGLVNISFPKAGLYMIQTGSACEPKTPTSVKPAISYGKIQMQHSCYYNNVFVEVKD